MKNKKVFTGLMFIFAGVALVLNRLGYFQDINIFSIFASIFLVSEIIKSISKRNIFGVLIPAAFLLVIYSDYLGISSLNPWIFVPAAVLISIGLDLIFSPRKNYYIKNGFNFNEESIQEDDKGYIYLFTSFSENIKYLKSNNLKTLALECNFGSLKVYLDNVTLDGDILSIEIDSAFSGIELYIPKNWEVIDNTSISFGGVKEKNRSSMENTKKVILTGDVNFTGVDIIYI